MAWEEFEYAEVETVLPAKILCVDELAQFVEVTDRKLMRLVDKFQGNIQSIARLGRAEHIHVVLATQSAMGNLFPSSLKNNVSQRFICGRVEANISRIAIDTEEGDSLPLTKGAYLGYSKQETLQFQGFYTPTKRVLSLGTVKPGYDPKTGLPIESEEELTPVSDYTEEERSKEESEDSSADSIGADDISFDLSSESDDVSEMGHLGDREDPLGILGASDDRPKKPRPRSLGDRPTRPRDTPERPEMGRLGDRPTRPRKSSADKIRDIEEEARRLHGSDSGPIREHRPSRPISENPEDDPLGIFGDDTVDDIPSIDSVERSKPASEPGRVKLKVSPSKSSSGSRKTLKISKRH